MLEKALYQRLVMGKYDALALEMLTDRWVSTNKLRAQLEKKTSTSVNWYLLHRSLTKLEKDGRAEGMAAGGMFLWRKKQ